VNIRPSQADGRDGVATALEGGRATGVNRPHEAGTKFGTAANQRHITRKIVGTCGQHKQCARMEIQHSSISSNTSRPHYGNWNTDHDHRSHSQYGNSDRIVVTLGNVRVNSQPQHDIEATEQHEQHRPRYGGT
jgi:hypothetical protein